MEDYQKQLEETQRYLAREKAQEEKGIFWLWPYDEKPQYDENRYGLPREGEIDEAKAIGIAEIHALLRGEITEAACREAIRGTGSVGPTERWRWSPRITMTQ